MSLHFENFTTAFAEYIKSGEHEKLAEYCDSGTNLEFFALYRNGFYRSVVETLMANYPTVQALLGDDYFRNLAKLYASEFPPTTGTLVGYGENFDCFLAKHEISERLPYLADIARLDRAWTEVYFAAGQTPITSQQVAELIGTPGDLSSPQIKLRASTVIVTLDYAVTSIWQQLKQTSKLTDVVEVTKKPEHVLVWRQQSSVLVRPLPLTEFKFLGALKAGSGLLKAAEDSIFGDEDFNLPEFFANVISAEILTST